MAYLVEINQVQPQIIAAIRLRATIPELPTVIPPACGEVWQFVRSAGIPNPGRNIAVYLDMVMNIEVGVEVGQHFSGTDRIICSSTPGGLTATTVHIGPYNRLGEAYDAVHKWCADNKREIAGPAWEVYGHWTDDPAKLQTDVFCLLKA
jgi:effector-binding domain-containing protein